MELCDRLTLIDLSDLLIDYCRDRFSGSRNVEYSVTDGFSITGVADESVNFVFSFDSLVHADIAVMRAYLQEVRRVLVPGGVAFLHHSNLAGCGPERVRRHMARDETVSAAKIREIAASTGLAVQVQELVPWHAENLEASQFIDCFTTLAQEPKLGEPRLVHNRLFEEEKRLAKQRFNLYSSGGYSSNGGR